MIVLSSSFPAVRLQEATQALAYSMNVAEIQSYVTEIDGLLQTDDHGKVRPPMRFWLSTLWHGKNLGAWDVQMPLYKFCLIRFEGLQKSSFLEPHIVSKEM